MPTLLSVNLNKLALLRNSRGRNYPDLLFFIKKLISLGVRGFTVHPRPDQRHIKYEDVYQVRDFLRSYPDVELNVEGNPSDRFLSLIRDIKPHQCTLVPDADHQLTSDHGYDVTSEGYSLSSLSKDMRAMGVRCAVFLDANVLQVDSAIENKIEAIELYTEEWASEYAGSDFRDVEERYRLCVRLANEKKLRVNAGHDLNLDNLEALLNLGEVSEVSIGHAFTVECIEYGIESVVSRYLDICQMSRHL